MPGPPCVAASTMAPAGAILLAIGAGGALKQVLVSAGLSDIVAAANHRDTVAVFSHGGVIDDCGMGEMNGLKSEERKLERVFFGGLTIRMEDR